MTKKEFANVIAYLEAGYGRPIADTPEEALLRTQAYFDSLGDLPVELLRIAARVLLLQQKWFPSISELRHAAVESVTDVKTSPAEAWALAWRAIGKIDPEVAGSIERACAGLPPLVVEAMQAMGIHALCYGKEPLTIVRSQFLKIYEEMKSRNWRAMLLPDAIRRDIAALPEQTRAHVLRIGRAPE